MGTGQWETAPPGGADVLPCTEIQNQPQCHGDRLLIG